MYSVAKNVQIVIALLKAHNVTQLVLSPGGTNAAFVRGVQDDPSFKCYSIVDERSAMYYAIGLHLATGKIVATCCTSAQATRNYIPGLTEAYYRHIPILAITFSKHPKFTYQGYMQAPDQTSLPKDSVKKTYSLPYISNIQDRLMTERMVNEAILELKHRECGPVQLNIPMLDTELTLDDTDYLPHVKKIERFNNKEIVIDNLESKRILIIVGENCSIDGIQISKFASSHNAVIYVNNLSNYRGEYTFFGNLFLSTITQEEFNSFYSPDVLITIGGQTGDYPLYHKLAACTNNYEHWRIAPNGDIVDTYDHLTRVYECSCYDFFSESPIRESIHEYYELFISNSRKIHTDMELPLSYAYIAQQLHNKIQSGSVMHFAILNSLRIWNLFPLNENVTCFSNVAAFGIDGCMSTFLGHSVETKNLCYLIIGDLAFFYDMNSLAIRYIKNNVRIILVNNNGGLEFKLGGQAELNKDIDRYIAASGHFKDAEGWALTNKFVYKAVREKEDFINSIPMITKSSKAPILLEVFTKDLDDSTAYSLLIRQNSKNMVFKRVVKKLFKK